MGREIRRVPLDFQWPLNKTWDGFLMDSKFDEDKCPDCDNGYGPEAWIMYRQWYGNAPFNPLDKGSTPLTKNTPAVREFAERNVEYSPEYYGSGEHAIQREATRLATLWNQQWGHHLSQEEVDYLVADDENGGIRDLTHKWDRETKTYNRIDPSHHYTSDEVNQWSILSFFNSIRWYNLVEWHCGKLGVPAECQTCMGHGALEAYPGQREEADKWEATEPPSGDGWQLWETVSEGSPITPVFSTPEDLARYLYSPVYTRDTFSTFESALNFVNAGWAPSSVLQGNIVTDGAEWVGTTTEVSS